jgi:hypothetical protein
MKRRAAIKSLTMILGGLTSIPAWASSWTPKTVRHHTFLRHTDDALLAEIVETIIPETSTPGAKSLMIHQFIQRMVYDCYSSEAVQLLLNGLKMTDEISQNLYNQLFINCTASQRKDIFMQLLKSENSKSFAKAIKELTIRGYTNSEYYLTHFTDYTMAPGFYHGCVPVKK